MNFITAPPSSAPSTSDRGQREWIGTTFDHLIDGCVSICLKSMDAFGNDSLVEEVLREVFAGHVLGIWSHNTVVHASKKQS